MERVCFILRVRPDRLDEYKERHRAVWPEMLDALRATGWTNYSLFLDDDGLLVGYLETEDFEAAQAAMEATRRQHALAGRDGRVPRAAAAPRDSRRSSTLTELRRHRPRRRERPRRRAAASTASAWRSTSRTGSRTGRCGCPTACAGTCSAVHRGARRPARARRAAARRRRRHVGRRLRAARRRRPRARAAVPLPRRAHRRDDRARARARRARGALRGHRHPDDADQHGLPAARRRGRRRWRRPSASRSSPT